jgi:cytochrome c
MRTALMLGLCAAPAYAQEVAIDLVDATGAKVVGNPANGEKIFKQCQTCHFLQEGKNFTGPTLYGIIGRKAGTIPGFSYSKANKESGKVWEPQVMFDYLENPRKAVPGTKMAFVGLKKPQDRADVISYIAANGGAAKPK